MTSSPVPSPRFSRELILFTLATFFLGMGYSIYDSIFNNFLSDRFTLSGFERSVLEIPRELPGLLVVFISASLWFLYSRRLGGVAMLLGAMGALLIGYASFNYSVMLVWLFVYSLGFHIFIPLSSSIGMELAPAGQAGRRLGQLNSLRNIAAIFGSGLIFIGFRFLRFSFQYAFTLAAIGLTIAGLFMFIMQPTDVQPARLFLKLRREYRLYYLLSVLFGSRKQLFFTFAPWVMITVFHQPTQTIATLITIGGVIGILFQPLLGWAIDHIGERMVLVMEAGLLIFVCFGYGYSKTLFAPSLAFLVACACYLLDQMLMAVNMARSTYIKKIALDPGDVQPALTVSVTIDHIFSIIVALLGGVIWNMLGYQYVFLLGVLIALLNLVCASRVRIPKQLS